MLEGLQSGRAVAAIMVAIFHANLFLLPKNFYAGEGAWPGFNFGYAGVEFFFVLSGFIMVLVHARDFGRPAQAPVFLRKRIVRIYPIYWIVLAALIAIYFAAPGRGPEHARDPLAILASFLLFPTTEGPIMQVAWTLQHEMLFYIIFTSLLFHLRAGMVIFGIWMVACFVAIPTYDDLPYPLSFLLKPHNILFLFGILSALVYKKLSRDQAVAALVLGVGGFLGLGLWETLGGLAVSHNVLPLGYGLFSALAVIGLAQGGLAMPRWLTFLGDASYSIYLVHLPVMNIAAVFLKRAGVHEILPPLAMLALITVIISIAGSLVHVYVEKPVMAALRRRPETHPASR